MKYSANAQLSPHLVWSTGSWKLTLSERCRTKPMLPWADGYKLGKFLWHISVIKITKPLNKDLEHSDIKHGNKGELFTHLRQMNKSKLILSNLQIPAQGCGWLEPLLAAQGARRDPPGPDTLQHRPLPPAAPHAGTRQTRCCPARARLWTMGGNRSPRANPQTWGANANSAGTGPGQESMCFPP